MTTIAPVNPRATVQAQYRHDENWPTKPIPAGLYRFYAVGDAHEPDGITFGCPCGCGSLMSVAFRPTRPGRPSWEWNGDRDRPTLSPSINILQFDKQGNRTGEHWHGWLQNGVFKSC